MILCILSTASPVASKSLSFPLDLVEQFEQIASALLACALAVFAFVPLVLEFAMQRSADPDKALLRFRRAGIGFDVLLVSITLYGVCICTGMAAIFQHWWWLYVMQAVTLCAATATMLSGAIAVGVQLRSFRKSGLSIAGSLGSGMHGRTWFLHRVWCL